ncbi:MAG: ABC transporter permease [Asticcacaulis sp.]
MIGFFNHIWLVAAREYKTATRTRSFRLTLLSVPLAILISIGAQILMRPPDGSAFIIIDRTGHYGQAIEHRLDLDHQRAVLISLSDYVARWRLEPYAPGAAWSTGRHWFADSEIEAFTASGGADAALKRLSGHIPKDAPAFEAPKADWYRIAPPPDVSAADAATFGRTVQPHMHEKVATPAGPRPLAIALYIPPTFGPADPRIEAWTDDRGGGELINQIRDDLSGRLRTEALNGAGLDPVRAQQVLALEPRFDVTAPPPEKSRGNVLVRSALPMALAYLLLISIITAGTKMLLGVVEERSNKLLESILACISPRELMYGKLCGVVAIGLTIVVFWGGCAAFAGYSLHGQLADFLRPALSSLESPWVAAELVVYFVSGYVMLAMILLAIGSSSNSMQDAQGYLQPVLMFIIIPYALMMSSMIRDPESLWPKVMSWIPVYTPFAMLARLGTGVSVTEIAGTTAVMLAFIVVEVIWLGRVFQNNLLNTGQPPKLLQMLGIGRAKG